MSARKRPESGIIDVDQGVNIRLGIYFSSEQSILSGLVITVSSRFVMQCRS
jgi:hypothetical protein